MHSDRATLPASGRVLYLPGLAIAGQAAWLSSRGWNALGPDAAADVNARRFQLAGPVMLDFLLVIPLIVLLGFHLTFSSGLAWTVLTVEAATLIMLGLTAWVKVAKRR